MSDKKAGARMRGLKLAGTALVLGAAVPLTVSPAWADEQSAASDAYENGFRSYQAGDYRTARIQLLNALKANPNNALARIMMARTALALGNGVEAQTELETAIEDGTPRSKVQHLMAHALLLQGKADQASQILDSTDFEPQFAGYAARLRGQVAAGNRDLETAEREFNRALALSPDDLDTVNVVARFLLALGQADEAKALLQPALQKRPGHIQSLITMGNIARRSEGLEASLPYFNRAVEVDRNSLEGLLERAATLGDLNRDEEARADLERINGLVNNHPMALYLEAVLETREGNTDKARQLMQQTRGMVNEFAPAMMLQGLLALDAGNVDTANDFLGRLVGRVPNSVTARKLYASAQMQKGDAEGALNTIQPILDADAADARTYAIAGAAMARTGNAQQAQAYLQQAEEMSGDSSVQNQLAMTQLMEGDTELAERTVQDVLNKDQESLSGLMMLALINMKDADFEEAEAASQRIIKAHPQLPIGYNLLGGALIGQGDRAKAEQAFRTALDKKPDYAEARRNLAQILIAKGDTGAAKDELRKVVNDNNRDTRALMTLAEIAGQQGDRREQLEWLQQATSVDRDAPAPRIALADAYLAANQPDRAQNEASSLLRDFPENSAALLAAARIYEASGRQDQLVSLFDRMVSVDSDRLLPRILLGRALQANGETDDARRAFQRALTITGENTTPAYLELIALEAREGRIDQAREWAVRLRNEQPDSNVAEVALGRAYLLADRPKDALAALSAARKKTFDLSTARAIAQAYSELGRDADAIKILQAYKKENPKDPGSLGSIAELQLNAGQYRQAAANYESLRKVIGNRDPGVLNNLAYAYLQIKDPRAVPVAKLAYDMAPANPAIADTYAWALLRTGGDKALALKLLRRASSTVPGNPEIRYHLAQAYLANGQRSEALQAVRQSLNGNAQFAEAGQARALLKRLGG